MSPRGAYTATPCRACRTPKPSRLYLCGNCWEQLPPAARRALTARGDRVRALARLRELHTHIDAGLPLGELEITA
ncbi:hypothetical protein E0L36_22165 [Streptomyces sp. AJS327]|uniref:hypothetical protein n=1 Tax=Streptomyces sp. AJS327 TaxID=2545265 RepID=UPI0015DD701F|nr:hypothetical protein [Streptomyces sp. AJS327]MBA0053483.1 hypothetical protein [Streptomyces sp. AJS327]